MSRVLKAFLAAAGVVGLTATAALAQPAPRGAGPGGVLNLTDAQRDEIRKLREETRAVQRADAQKLQEATRRLREALLADDPDQRTVAALRDEVAQLSHQLQARRLDQQERVSRIFTPEQRRLLREHRGLFRARRALMRERRELIRDRRELMRERRHLIRQRRQLMRD